MVVLITTLCIGQDNNQNYNQKNQQDQNYIEKEEREDRCKGSK